MPLTKEEITQIATRTADEVMERVRERERDSLLLNSIPYAYGSPGIVVNEATAKASPCRCIEYRPGKKLCFSKGIVGALSDEQEKIYCPTIVPLESPGLERRMESWMESVETCKAEIAEIPKGERLEPWLSCMSRQLAAKEIRVEIGSSVCDRYTGSCGRIVDILDDEVLIEPTTIKGKIDQEYLESTEPFIRVKKVNLAPDHLRRYELGER